MQPAQIRNFTIIGHIDHGKSTLADRLLELTNTVAKREMRKQYLDKLQLERERGITIKLQTVRMEYRPAQPILNFELFILNLIDTPGHVDFSYEVSRSLAACEGAVLIVDATQGVQAQTLANFFKAKEANLTIIPVINKIDLSEADVEGTTRQLTTVLGFSPDELLTVSAKTGEGVDKLLNTIVKKIPPPQGNNQTSLRALIFDSYYDEHKGVIALVRIVDGQVKPIDELLLMAAEINLTPVEIGFITSKLEPIRQLSTGEVGYIATGIKDIKSIRMGDTITSGNRQQAVGSRQRTHPLPGYQEPKPLVLAHLFPVETAKINDLRTALEKLSLNDAAFTYHPIFSKALGAGFSGGFLGLLHLTIIQERLSQELGVEIVVTTPTVEYQAGKEPWVRVKIFTPRKYLGSLMRLCQERRGLFINTEYLLDQKKALGETDQLVAARLIYELPLAELVTDFADQLKSLSTGYASYDYEFLEYRQADLVTVAILINQKPLEELSFTTVRAKAPQLGRQVVDKLKDLIPRQQFKVPVQAAIGGKVIARADISALRKDVTAKLYGGDRTRKDKLLKKQAAGKRRLKKFGQVSIPQEAFLEILKSN